MSRLSTCFKSLRALKKTALVAYIVGGDYDIKLCAPLMHGLVANGVDVIELGYPFSDPAAEGVAIQQGHQRALEAGTCLADVLDAVATFRTQDSSTPVVLMGYLNPIEQMGYSQFAERANSVGADGVLIVDLPLEAAAPLSSQFASHNLDLVLLSSPTTTRDRAVQIGKRSKGYLYCVTLKGLTGADSLEIENVRKQLKVLKRHAKAPICVGFGIKSGDQAREVAQLADGVVIGSVLVETIGAAAQERLTTEEIVHSLAKILTPIRAAVDTNASNSLK